MCARSPATWAAISAATATSRNCAAPRSIRSRPKTSCTLDELEAAAPPKREPDAEPKPFARQRSDRFAALDAFVVDTGAALDCLPQIAITDDAAAKIRLGNPVILRGRDAPVEAEEACATVRGRLVAIGAIEAGMFKPKRVFAG